MPFETHFGLPGKFLNPIIRSGAFLLTMTIYIGYYKDYANSRPWRVHPEITEVFDFIVVGGGSAGAVVANRLSKHHQVLLLDLGGDPHPLTNLAPGGSILIKVPGADLMYETIRQNNSALSLPNHVMPWPRGMGLGGSGNLNSMIYQRGNPNDYDNWANITGDPAWSYSNLLPFFKKLEDYNGEYPNDEYHSKGGPIHIEKARFSDFAEYFLKAAKEKGYRIHDPSGRQTEGFSELDVNMKHGLRSGTFQGYIKPIRKRRNLTIHRFSRAVKIHLDKNRHAYGLTYYRFGMKRFVRARKEIISSAGSIDSPKLLMLSGIGPKKHLNSVGLKCRVNLRVGQNLQDHVATSIAFLVDVGGALNPLKHLRLKTLVDFAKRKGIGVSSGMSAIGQVTSTVRNDTSWPDIQYQFAAVGMTKLALLVFERTFNLPEHLTHKQFSSYYGHDANLILQVLGRPKSVGEIKLASLDPFDKPIINPNYYSHEDDIKAMVDGFKTIVDLFENTKTYNAINGRILPVPWPDCEKEVFRSDRYYECSCRHVTMTTYHPVGTVAMGQNWNVSGAVVDSELRVFKTTGLRVIDASIMPVIVNANTNIPAIMIGEVGSFFIRRYWAEQYEVSRRQQTWFSWDDHKCFYSRHT